MYKIVRQEQGVWITANGEYLDLVAEDWGICNNPPLGIHLYPQLSPEPTDSEYDDDSRNHEFY